MELTREHFRAMIFYDFKAGLNQEECVQRLKLAFGDESPAHATVFRWFKEFSRGRNFLQDEEHTGRPPSAVIPDNVSAIRKMLDDNRCTYQMIQKELNIGSTAIHKIIHEELHMKKVVCRWVPHNLTEHQKEECVRISKETLKLLNDGGHRIISKIVIGDETYIPFFDVPTRQESKVWVFEDDPTLTMVKRQCALKKVMHAVFFRSTGLVKAIKLEGQKTVTADWYTTKCLPEILQEVNVRGLMLHHDNASSHTAGLTVEFLKQKQIKVIEHSPYPPDLAMCDFWLFFNLKKNLRGRCFHSEEEIDVAINAFFSSIPRNEWLEAFNLWKIRLQKCIDAGGDYFEHI